MIFFSGRCKKIQGILFFLCKQKNGPHWFYSHLVYGFLITVKGTAVAQWIALAAHGQWVVVSNFVSHQVHW